MQCACTIFSCVACLALRYFSTLSHKWHDLKNKLLNKKMCGLIFSTSFVWNISHYKKNWARYGHKYTFFVRHSHYSCQILMKLGFSQQIFRNYWNKILWKSVQLELSCSKRLGGGTNGQTDVIKLIIAFRIFANMPKGRTVGYFSYSNALLKKLQINK